MAADKSTISPDEENLWSKVLEEVQSKSAITLPQGAILVLGDNEAGKTSLIAKLKRNDEPRKGAGLEYHHLLVNPDYTDGTYAYQLGSALPDVGPGESTRLGVWVVDGDTAFAPLLRFALDADTLERSVVLLCASMQQPWSIVESLQRWARLLEDHVQFNQSSVSGIDANLLNECKDKQVRFWQEYLEPLDSSSHSELGAKVPSMESAVDAVLLPLCETTLTHNVGIPIIVVITKCDTMQTTEKDYDFREEHWDFIQQHIRKFCLSYGAALIYTSVKEARNCDILYKYLLHRIYGFPFTLHALVVDKDAVFIPAGWDNEKKIGILYENLISMKPDDLYSEHVRKPVVRRTATTKESEVLAEEEQLFLQRQQTILASKTTANADTQQAASPQPQRKQPPQQHVSSATPTVQTSGGGGGITSVASVAKDGKNPAAGAAGTADGGTALAQFFNNLLQKGAPPAAGGENPTLNTSKSFEVRGNTDAEAELQRMLSQGRVSDQNSNRKPSPKQSPRPRNPATTNASVK